MTKKTKTLLGVGVALALVSGSAGAAATYCSDYTAPTTHPGGLSTSDVNYSVTGAAPYNSATDCYGHVTGQGNAGNIQPSTVLTQWAGGWAYADANNSNSGVVSLYGGNFTFSLAAVNGAPSGTYTLSATDDNGAAPPNFAFYLDFVIAVKAANGYALYFFDEALFDGSGGGQWWVKFDINPAGNYPGLSHMIAFVRPGNTPPPPPDRVPEPGTLALLGLGLIGLGAARRRPARA